jgi:hypothetical protein
MKFCAQRAVEGITSWLVSGQAWDANSLALGRRTNLRAEFFPAVSRNRSCANVQRVAVFASTGFIGQQEKYRSIS